MMMLEAMSNVHSTVERIYFHTVQISSLATAYVTY